MRGRLATRKVLRLVVAGGLGAAALALLVTDSRPDVSTYLVFADDMPGGTRLETGTTREVRADVPAEQARRLVRAEDVEAVEGSFVEHAHEAGEFLTWASVTSGPGASGYTVVVPSSLFAGNLESGDTVDVIVSGGTTRAAVVASGVEVTHVEVGDSAGPEGDLLRVGIDAERDVLLDIEDASAEGRLRVIRSGAEQS
jgi:hypothetical protein